MDSTVLGVIIGAAASVLGTFLGHIFTYHKEKTQWKREQLAKAEEKANLEEKERKKDIKDIYSNIIRILSLIEHVYGKQETSSSERKYLDDLIKEASYWLSLLEINLLETNNTKAINELRNKRSSFLSDPGYFTRFLFDFIANLVTAESSFNKDMTKFNDSVINIKTRLSNETMKKLFIDGYVSSKWHSFDILVSEIPPSQREKLIKPYLIKNEIMPESITLQIPTNAENSITEDWMGDINPQEMSKTEILSLWERDYIDALGKTSAGSDQAK